MKRSLCPISHALDVLGDRWSLLIIRDLAFRGMKTFSEFESGPEKIATNILSVRLRALEQAEIIVKKQNLDDRRRFEYELTPAGKDLLPVLLEIFIWSAKHDPDTAANKTLVEHARKDRDQLLARMRSNLENRTFTLNAIED